MTTCKCETCIGLRTRREYVEVLPKEHQKYFEGLLEYILDLEYDKQFTDSLKDGSWPNGKEVLERMLEKYK